MERNDIENINSNQSKQCSYGGAKRSDRGGAHGGGAGLHPSRFLHYLTFLLLHELHFFLRIFLLIAGVIQGTEETERLVFDGICLLAES